MSLLDVIQVSGSDARSFLQGQLTQDVRERQDPPAPLAAWCNPKGRVIAILRVIRLDEDTFLLGVPSDLADAIVERLLMFRFRARVEITGRGSKFEVLAFSNAGHGRLKTLGLLPEEGSGHPSRRDGLVALETGVGPRLVEVYGKPADLRGAALAGQLSDEDWKRSLIEAGVAAVGKAGTEKYTPHMLNLDRLGAISFSKGCYTGQEVVARTEHLGRSKRRLMHFLAAETGAAAGDRLQQGGQDVGEVINAVGRHLLAVAPVSSQRSLRWNGRPLLPVELPYSLD